MSGKMKILATLIFVATLAAGAAFAQGGGFPGMMGRDGNRPMAGFGPENLGAFRMLAGRLDLTDEQTEQIEAILSGTREEIQAILEEAGPPEERPGFLEMFAGEDLTVADLEENFSGMDETREAIRSLAFTAIVEIHDILTAEQLAELAELAGELGGFGQGMGGGMMGGGGGSHPGGGGPHPGCGGHSQ